PRRLFGLALGAVEAAGSEVCVGVVGFDLQVVFERGQRFVGVVAAQQQLGAQLHQIGGGGLELEQLGQQLFRAGDVVLLQQKSQQGAARSGVGRRQLR